MRYTYEQPEYLDKVGVVHLVQQLKIYIDGIATGDIDLSDYVTKAELQAKLDALDINIDLSAYATKEELTNALRNIDLSAYATKEYVTNAINNAQLGGDGSSVDLSIYAKKSDLDSKANTNHTHTMSDITDYTAPDLSSYAKKTDIPSLSGYATKTYVDQNKFSGSYNDLTDKPTIPSIDGLATTEYVDNAVANVPTGEPTKDLLYESVIRQGGAVKSQSGSLENDEIFTLENYYGANYSNNTTSYVNEYITKGLYIYIEPEKILTHGYDMYGSEVEEGGYTEEEKAQHSIEFANKLIREGKYKGVFAIKCTSDAVEYNYNDAWLTNDDLVIGKPLYVYGYVLDTFCGLSQGAYILKVIPSGTIMKKTDIVEVIPVAKERVKVPCNLSLVNHLSMFSTGESPHYKKQWKQYDTSRRCTDRERNEVITFPKGNDDSEFVLSRFGYPQYTITNGVPQGIVLQDVDYGTSSGCYLISKGLERETYISGNPGISIVHYSLDEWAKKIDDDISKEISDGISPTVSIAETDNGHTVSITDVNGTQSFDVTNGTNGSNGTNGTNGTDGVSPTVTVTKEGKVATITCTDVNGTTTATISDGADGSGGGSSGGSTDVYSTEETAIGTWIDGSTIYRKVIEVGNLAFVSSGNYGTVTTTFSDVACGELLRMTGIIKYGTSTHIVADGGFSNLQLNPSTTHSTYINDAEKSRLTLIGSSTSVKLWYGADWGGYNYTLVVEYTKSA